MHGTYLPFQRKILYIQKKKQKRTEKSMINDHQK